MFGRQAIGMMWDFAEPAFCEMLLAILSHARDILIEVLARGSSDSILGHVEQASATAHPLPDDAASAIVTDPPYYDAVPYAYLSDFFYVWLRRTLADVHPCSSAKAGVPKGCRDRRRSPAPTEQETKDIAFYERELTKAFAEGRRVLAPIGRRDDRLRQQDHGLVGKRSSRPSSSRLDHHRFLAHRHRDGNPRCRAGASAARLFRPPRLPPTRAPRRLGSDGRDRRLARRTRRTAAAECTNGCRDLPRKASSGRTPSSPASARRWKSSPGTPAWRRPAARRSRSRSTWSTSGRPCPRRPLADLPRRGAAGLEPDARLTAMWLWTLSAGETDTGGDSTPDEEPDEEPDDDDEESNGRAAKASGFTLEFDAARKIAQGLGIHLEASDTVVEVKGEHGPSAPRRRTDQAPLRQGHGQPPRTEEEKRPRGLPQGDGGRFAGPDGRSGDEIGPPKPGATVLDRLHQAMILFGTGAGRGAEDVPRRRRAPARTPASGSSPNRCPPSTRPAPTRSAGSRRAGPQEGAWVLKLFSRLPRRQVGDGR